MSPDEAQALRQQLTEAAGRETNFRQRLQEKEQQLDALTDKTAAPADAVASRPRSDAL